MSGPYSTELGHSDSMIAQTLALGSLASKSMVVQTPVFAFLAGKLKLARLTYVPVIFKQALIWSLVSSETLCMFPCFFEREVFFLSQATLPLKIPECGHERTVGMRMNEEQQNGPYLFYTQTKHLLSPIQGPALDNPPPRGLS